MKYYIIAGEASGDLHAANLMKEIKLLDKKADFRAWGGNLMQQEGAKLTTHYKDLAFMGFVDVLLNIGKIRKNFKVCKTDLLAYNPDILILVDYPGFNLRIAEFAKKHQITTYYYISPKIWAWKKSRAWKIKKYIDKMFVIFPFEQKFYEQYEYDVEYVGNPLVDEIEKKRENLQSRDKFLKNNNLDARPIIALLPGSRRQELKFILPEMLKVVDKYSDYQFIIAGAPSFSEDDYSEFTKDTDVKIIFSQTYDLLNNADAAIVTSGTATLETAIFNIPQVVVYKTMPIQYNIGKHFIKIKFFSLVNIIMDCEIVKELLQNDLEQQIDTELDKILNDKKYRTTMLKNYEALRKKLGTTGASQRAAQQIVNDLRAKN